MLLHMGEERPAYAETLALGVSDIAFFVGVMVVVTFIAADLMK